MAPRLACHMTSTKFWLQLLLVSTLVGTHGTGSEIFWLAQLLFNEETILVGSNEIKKLYRVNFSYLPWNITLKDDWRSCHWRTSNPLCTPGHTPVCGLPDLSVWCYTSTAWCRLRFWRYNVLHFGMRSSLLSHCLMHSPPWHLRWLAHKELNEK